MFNSVLSKLVNFATVLKEIRKGTLKVNIYKQLQHLNFNILAAVSFNKLLYWLYIHCVISFKIAYLWKTKLLRIRCMHYRDINALYCALEIMPVQEGCI